VNLIIIIAGFVEDHLLNAFENLSKETKFVFISIAKNDNF